jgi:hypothetical protein
MPTINLTNIAFTEQIAFFLNEGEKVNVWRRVPQSEATPTEAIAKITDKTCELRLHFDWPKAGKLSISGNFHFKLNKTYAEWVDVREWDTGTNGRAAYPEITVSTVRGAQTIACEIKRRMLPEYLRLHAKAAEQVAHAREYQGKRIVALKALAAIVGEDLTKKLAAEPEMDRFNFYRESASGEVWACPTEANLTLRSIPLDKAQRILAICME